VKLDRALRRRLFEAVVLPVLSVACGFVVAGVAVLLTGNDPIAAFTALFQGAFTNDRAFGETLVATIPYIFLGLAVALGFRAGLFNIGAEGQFYLGAIFGVLAGNHLQGLPGILHIPVALAFGMLGGFLWAAISACSRATTSRACRASSTSRPLSPSGCSEDSCGRRSRAFSRLASGPTR